MQPNQENNEKIQAFLKEYQELVDKHKIDFANYPMWVPDGEGSFKTIIQSTPFDMTQLPVKSPFVAKE